MMPCQGFICGSDHGLVTLYERLEDVPYFKKNKTFKVFDNLVKIKSISLSPSEETLVCTLENNQAFAFPLNQADILDEGNHDNNNDKHAYAGTTQWLYTSKSPIGTH
jgi:hypothetical protein